MGSCTQICCERNNSCLPIAFRDGEVSPSYGDGGVMGVNVEAHDPSGPSGHLPTLRVGRKIRL